MLLSRTSILPLRQTLHSHISPRYGQQWYCYFIFQVYYNMYMGTRVRRTAATTTPGLKAKVRTQLFFLIFFLIFDFTFRTIDVCSIYTWNTHVRYINYNDCDFIKCTVYLLLLLFRVIFAHVYKCKSIQDRMTFVYYAHVY